MRATMLSGVSESSLPPTPGSFAISAIIQRASSVSAGLPQDSDSRRHLTSLRRQTTYAKKKTEDFPRPVKIGSKGMRWWTGEVKARLRSRPRSVGM